jgi:uncharacterized protein (DUF1330 family)
MCAKVNVGAAIEGHIQRIDETLAPYGGRFIVHGGRIKIIALGCRTHDGLRP